MARGKGRGRGPDSGGVEATYFEAMVNAPDGRPFVMMSCTLDGEPVFAAKMSPALCTALGLRAIQTAIEAERDAGFVKFLRENGAEDGMIATMLSGLREFREQFDAEIGTTAKLSAEDRTELTDDPPQPEEG